MIRLPQQLSLWRQLINIWDSRFPGVESFRMYSLNLAIRMVAYQLRIHNTKCPGTIDQRYRCTIVLPPFLGKKKSKFNVKQSHIISSYTYISGGR